MNTTPSRIRLTQNLEVPDGTSVRKFDKGSLISQPSPELLAHAEGKYEIVDKGFVEERKVTKAPKDT